MVSIVEVEKYLKRCLKNKVKISKALILSFLVMGNLGFADDQNTPTEIKGPKTGVIYSVSSGKDEILENLHCDIQEEGDNEARVDVTGGNLTVKDTLDIKIHPKEGNKSTRPKGIIVRGKSDSKIENLKVDIALASEEDKDKGSADSNAAYGVAVGYESQGGANGDITILRVNNADIKVANTEGTIFWKKDAKGIAKVTFGHQLSGIRVYKENGATPEFISDGKVNIIVEDKSTSKSGDYLVGVYASGENANIIFNGDTNIKVIANGKYSAGIKIGKSGDNKGSATVTSHGKLFVDTTQTKESAAVRLFSKNSKFEVTGKNNKEEASKIKSGNSAIVFDTQDYEVKGKAKIIFTINIGASRNENVENPVVKLNNTILETTSEDASLIKVKAEKVKDESFGKASKFYNKFNSGTFNVKNAQFTLKGEKSEAIAPSNGWLIEVQGQKGNSSDLTVNIEDSAKVYGLTHKEHSSKLDMNIENATWQLKKKGNIDTATATSINLKEGATLDAKDSYTVKLTTDGVKTDGKLTNAGTINLVNDSYGDVLTIKGNYEGTSGVIKLNTKWDRLASESDTVKIEGEASGTTVIVPVSNNNVENIIDGNIGDIDKDLEKRTVPVITVNTVKGNMDDIFKGTAKTSGAGEVQLKGEEKDGKTEYYWTLKSINKNPILAQSVSGYVQMPTANFDIAYDSLRSLNEREGENNTVDVARNNDELWARYLAGQNTYQGKIRMNMNRTNKGVQIGTRFIYIEDNRIGAYLTYQKNKLYFEDRMRAENAVILDDKYTGTGKVDSLSLGITNTRIGEKGQYIDLVGQVTLLSNEYNSRDNVKAKNSAVDLSLSAEVAKPYTLKETGNKIILEPQAQIIYQKLISKKFNDGNKDVMQGNTNYLRARLGLKLAYTDDIKVFYAGINLWHRLLDAGKVQIGDDDIQEKYVNTTIDLSIGMKHPIFKKGFVYGDYRYQHSIGKLLNNSLKGTIGIKYYFD